MMNAKGAIRLCREGEGEGSNSGVGGIAGYGAVWCGCVVGME